MDDKVQTQFCEAITLPEEEVQPNPEAPRYLIMLGGGMPGAMVRVSLGTLWIGRREDNDLILQDPSISRRHASIRLDSNGSAWLSDLGSTNGTFRNGSRLKPREPVRVFDRDRIRVGTSLIMKFACPDPEEEDFQRRMFERTVRDPLTGLFNRVYFFDQLRALARSVARRDLGLAVLMMDVDHFKLVNDSLGHAGGDVVLREVAARVRRCARSEDLVARYGGEEFILALPVATASIAMNRAEAIRRSVAQPPIHFGEQKLSITASLGLAFACQDNVHDGVELITEADRCLYQAKRNGRNRVHRRIDRETATPLAALVTE